MDVRAPVSVYAPESSYDVYRCSGCGLGVTVPIPDPEQLARIYANTYSYDSHDLIAPEKRWRARRVLDQLEGGPYDSLLDIGCMHGELLGEAQNRGFERVEGIELSDRAAARARERGYEVSTGTIEEYVRRGHAPFDVIVAQHALEHATNSDSFLRATYSVLRENGRLVLCLPHFGSWMRRVFRRTWGWYQVPVHLLHYSPEALKTVSARNGFRVERVRFRGGDSLMVVLTLLYSLRGSGDVTSGKLTGLQRSLISIASLLLRPYYYIGADEMVALLRKHGREKSFKERQAG